MGVSWQAGLRQTLAALKSYFLLARGDLFTVFVDIAEKELSKNAGDVILTRLQSLLELGVCPVLVLGKKGRILYSSDQGLNREPVPRPSFKITLREITLTFLLEHNACTIWQQKIPDKRHKLKSPGCMAMSVTFVIFDLTRHASNAVFITVRWMKIHWGSVLSCQSGTCRMNTAHSARSGAVFIGGRGPPCGEADCVAGSALATGFPAARPGCLHWPRPGHQTGSAPLACFFHRPVFWVRGKVHQC